MQKAKKEFKVQNSNYNFQFSTFNLPNWHIDLFRIFAVLNADYEQSRGFTFAT